MSSAKFVVGHFDSFARGHLCQKPSDFGAPVALDRKETRKPHPRMKYLIEIVYTPATSKIRFGILVKSKDEIFDDLIPILTQAKWTAPKDLFANNTAEIVCPVFGKIQAEFYLPPKGRYGSHPYVSVKFEIQGSPIEFIESGPSIEELKRAVERSVGPAADLSAIIARRRNMNARHW